jgi:hypothetical protein
MSHSFGLNLKSPAGIHQPPATDTAEFTPIGLSVSGVPLLLQSQSAHPPGLPLLVPGTGIQPAFALFRRALSADQIHPGELGGGCG